MKSKITPLPVNILANALQDPIHIEYGKSQAAKSIKTKTNFNFNLICDLCGDNLEGASNKCRGSSMGEHSFNKWYERAPKHSKDRCASHIGPFQCIYFSGHPGPHNAPSASGSPCRGGGGDKD